MLTPISWDFFRSELEQFQWDVHVLILGTAHASIQYVDAQAEIEARKIEGAIKNATDDEYREYLINRHIEVFSMSSSQEWFVYNFALVALASRLTHALRKMASWAEGFSPRLKKYGLKADSEFERLWKEYADRFAIDFVSNESKIGYTETLRKIRNQIVHEGSEANPFLRVDAMNLASGDAGMLDLSFSTRYPDYVDGSGIGAVVKVSKDQLDYFVNASIELAEWLAAELRRQEVAWLAQSASRIT